MSCVKYIFLKCKIYVLKMSDFLYQCKKYVYFIHKNVCVASVSVYMWGGTQRGFGGATSKTCFRIETSIFESQL